MAVEVTAGKPYNVRRYGRDVFYTRPVVIDGLAMTWEGYARHFTDDLARFRTGTLMRAGGLYHEDGERCGHDSHE